MTDWRIGVVLVVALALAGCASDVASSPEFDIPAGQYAKAFDDVRDILAGYRFELDRVDAAAGVIATAPKTTAGLATPWDPEQTTFEQDVDDLANQQQRTARFTFDTPGGPADLRQATGPVHGRVEVVIERTRRPGWRLDTTSLRLSSFTQDPVLTERGLWPRYEVAIEQDPLLAGRMAAEMRKRLGQTEPGVAPVTPAKKPQATGTGEPGL